MSVRASGPHLPPSQGPVYLLLLWPDPLRANEWRGRLKDLRDGGERELEHLSEVLAALAELERRRSWD